MELDGYFSRELNIREMYPVKNANDAVDNIARRVSAGRGSLFANLAKPALLLDLRIIPPMDNKEKSP